ncbi:hypothetical protein [Pseudarthrobacter sulfonivorans]|jgi:hypothetical protein|uniref:hypothetical protein n=1 Tax=Pseudarthrobacter sulfonivorans TaxID=121292 RepID=UPI002861D7FE|nr:hypothetical protein [Pseudarthrobacter sulfonivorans]MDR6417264.1 hypothetical protein [Pseudarthrobacter sulfonivorans]
MDRIEQLMKDAKPRVAEPRTASAAAARSIVFSDDPNVVQLSGPRPPRRTAVRVAVAALAAAAVMGGVVVAGGMRGPEMVPAPAGTSEATPTPTATPTLTATTEASPTPAPSPSATGPAVPSTGGVPCTVANIDQLMQTQAPAIKPIPETEQHYYTVLGCADGWLAYSISDDGVRDLQLDGGNAWYHIARLQNGRFLFDVQAPWSTVFSWKFQALNNDVSQNGKRVTAQEAMDKEFAQKGIPVELRPQLVGEGPVDAG